METEDAIRLRRAVMRLARDLRKTAAEEGLTPTESSVLALVVRHEEMALSDVAKSEGLNPTMLSRVIKGLEESDLLVRVTAEDDRRSARVKPSANGKRLMQRLRNRRTDQLVQRVEQLDAPSLAKLEAALPALEALAGTE